MTDGSVCGICIHIETVHQGKAMNGPELLEMYTIDDILATVELCRRLTENKGSSLFRIMSCYFFCDAEDSKKFLKTGFIPNPDKDDVPDQVIEILFMLKAIEEIDLNDDASYKLKKTKNFKRAASLILNLGNAISEFEKLIKPAGMYFEIEDNPFLFPEYMSLSDFRDAGDLAHRLTLAKNAHLIGYGQDPTYGITSSHQKVLDDYPEIRDDGGVEILVRLKMIKETTEDYLFCKYGKDKNFDLLKKAVIKLGRCLDKIKATHSTYSI